MDRVFLGGCAVAKLTADLAGTDSALVLSMSTMDGWNFVQGEVFEVSVDRGTSHEEKMLCTIGSRNPDGTGTLSVYKSPTDGHTYRGWDDTSIKPHLTDATVEHVWTAIDARESLHAVKSLAAAPAHSHGTWRSLLGPTTTP